MDLRSQKSRSKSKALTSEQIRTSLPKDFCPLPFKQMFFYPTGEVFTCCEIGYKLGDAQKSSLKEIWNGKDAQNLREEFLSGKPVTCATQIKFKRCHLANEHLLTGLELNKVQAEPAQAFDLMLNGKCNLECVMCPVWTLPNQVYDQSTFWQEGKDGIFANLKQISVKSGEPFIQKDTYRLIEQVSAVNTECQWQFTTNGQYKLTPYIIDHLDKIKLDCIRVSIDSIDEINYPKIRKRGDLAKTLATLDGFADYRDKRLQLGRGFELSINMAVQKQNWMEPPKLIELAEKKGATPIFLFVYTPLEESITSLPAKERVEILNYYLDFLSDRPKFSRSLGTIMRPIMGSLPDDLKFDAILRWTSLGEKSK
jgi:MoaA/NifB/PqqE/SkfB family radical SAM enzyme